MNPKEKSPRARGALEAAVEAAAANTVGIRDVTGCEVQANLPAGPERESARVIAVRLKMVVEYGSNIPKIGEKVTGNVRQAIFRISGWDVSDICLEVEGVHLPECTTEERAEEG